MGTKRALEGGEEASAAKIPANAGHWALGLLSAMKDPNLIVQEDDQIVVIKDKYPKAECHYLVIPKMDIASLKNVSKEHLPLLKEMHKVGKHLAAEQPERTFKIGYHAEASMSRLHLHVISDEFNSPSLKTKKHWNSYTSEFFLPYKVVYNQVKTKGKVEMKSSDECKLLLGQRLQCHKCKFVSNTIPNLKKHVLTHREKEVEKESD